MSTFAAPIVKFTLEEHPNADTLSIANIKGWQCIVKTEEFLDESYGVYIPLDAVADKDHPLLGFMKGKKVKTVRLRQVISQGILLPLSKVIKEYNLDSSSLKEGDDLHEVLGIKKWRPSSQPMRLSGGSKPYEVVERPGWLSKYTDIERWNNYPDVIKEGEEVFITEKLHGTSAIFAVVDGRHYIASRNRCLRIGTYTEYLDTNISRVLEKFPILNKFSRFFKTTRIHTPVKTVWHDAFEKYNIASWLENLQQEFKTEDVAIYGEIVGVQDLMYGLEKGDIAFYAYDFRIHGISFGGVDYLSPGIFFKTAEKYNIPTVPLLKKGKFELKDLEMRNGQTTLNASHCREGIIIEPKIPRHDMRLGRTVLKRIGEDYEMRKGATDY